LIDHILCLRTLASVLAQLGCPRSACAVMAEALAHVEGSGQPGISSMALESAGRVLLLLDELPAARVAGDAAAEAARSMQVTEHMLNVSVLDLEIRARTPGADVQRQALELLTDTTRRGFGLLAHRCLALVDNDGPEWALRASARWQLRGSGPAPARDDAGSLAAEIERLEPLHPPRRWMEWRCLRRRAWQATDFPHHLGGAVARVIGDFELASASAPFDVDEASVGEGATTPIVFDDLLAAMPYGATVPAFRRAVMDAASTPNELMALLERLVGIAAVQVDSATVLFDASNCARRLGEFGDAALMADSGFRALVTFWRTTPAWVRLPLIVGFALDLLEQDLGAEAAVNAVRIGLQGGPLITTGMPANPVLKSVGSDDSGDYASAAEMAAAMGEMNMTGAFTELEKGSADWWTARIVEDALTPRRRIWDRRPDEKTQQAAQDLIDALARIDGHTDRRRAIEVAAGEYLA
jgi:hypothetical protein